MATYVPIGSEVTTGEVGEGAVISCYKDAGIVK